MRRSIVLCCLVLLFTSDVVFSQTQYGFRITFTDKNGTPHSTASPSTFLSPRAIARRTAMGISVDNTDLPVSPDYMDSVLTLTSGKLHMTSKWMNYTVVLLNDSSQILNLQGKPFISKIEYIAYYLNGLHKPAKEGNAETPESVLSTAKTTGTAAYYGSTYSQVSIVNGDYLHDIGWKGEGKLIAVLDEGFNNVNTGPAFDSLMNSGRLIDQYNFAKANTNVFSESSHGTQSLSTIAGNIPGTYVGTAPNADYALYITEIRGSEQVIEMDNIMAASERADSVGADIMTISLGYDQFNLPSSSYSLKYADIDGKTTIAAKAVNIATSKGILFIVSAGNEGGGSWNYILTPGDADSALTVGSVGLNKVPAGTSGYGPNAAGHQKPNVCMVGQPASVITSGSNPSFSNGTSLATPQLAGWAACLMQASGTFTPYQIRTAIEKSAHMYFAPGVQLGYGVPNFHYALELLNIKEPLNIPDKDNWLKVGPVPFDKQLSLRIYRPVNGTLDIILTDITGRMVYKMHNNVYIGTQNITLSVPDLPAGIYTLKAIADDDETVLKLVKR
jgi:serine protease AprX